MSEIHTPEIRFRLARLKYFDGKLYSESLIINIINGAMDHLMIKIQVYPSAHVFYM